MSSSAMIRKPSAYLPAAMSFATLASVLIFLARFGIVHEADEGTAAHIWQLLMGAQVPIVAFFAIKWLPQAPKAALPVLAMQAGAGLAAARLCGLGFSRILICFAFPKAAIGPPKIYSEGRNLERP
jgi:hypothetical protein